MPIKSEQLAGMIKLFLETSHAVYPSAIWGVNNNDDKQLMYIYTDTPSSKSGDDNYE